MDFLAQFLGGLSLILFCALIFGEMVSASVLMDRPSFQSVAVLLIMLVGAAAGVVALGAITFYGVAPTGLFGTSGLTIQVLGVCAAVLLLGGAFIARRNLLASGVLLCVGCLGLLFTYGFNRVIGIPIALAAIAASAALMMVNDGRGPSWTQRRA